MRKPLYINTRYPKPEEVARFVGVNASQAKELIELANEIADVVDRRAAPPGSHEKKACSSKKSAKKSRAAAKR
jgi:hypothetical protein